VILKGYFDESGDANDVNETSVSVAGYLGPVEAWDHLESEWQSVLKKFDVPCLHMFQLKARSGPFSKWTKGDPKFDELEGNILAELAKAIGATGGLYGFGHTVDTRDLRKFNQEFGMKVKAKAFALAHCLLSLRAEFRLEDIELTLDRMTKPQNVIATATEYFSTDRRHADWMALPTLSPLPERGARSSKDVLPLQAADFLVWEARKDYELKREFLDTVPLLIGPNFGNEIMNWFLNDRMEQLFKGKSKSVTIPKMPMRRSLIALSEATPIVGAIWRLNNLVREHDDRGGVWSRSDVARAARSV
jgi:hypothetical protein